MAIGICDWGIGGVGIYQLLRKSSNVNVVYFSDTGFTPYGKVPENELKARLSHVFLHFNKLGIEKIIVGCNAASTVLGDDKNITGIIEHGINVVLKAGIKEVGIVGGKRTIESEIYKNKLEANGIQVYQRIAQPLSARIEAGDIDSDGLMEDIQAIFSPIQTIPHILLACTHYPLIANRIIDFTGQAVLLDPAQEMCNWILSTWDVADENGLVQWQTSGDTNQMKYSLSKLYQIETNHIEKIDL